ncbi:fimbrial protein [Siccibacter turicensis]|uniref:fimbrial protein n=1 Tax=Siccibacter turicensis TaxID=357233 RepID=UPI003F547C7A
MKNIVTGFALAAGFFSSAVLAEPTSQDVPATLNISGTATRSPGCSVVLSKQSITLTSAASDLIKQGEDATAAETVSISIVDASGEGIHACDDEMYQGHLGVTFNGQADSVQGNVFANTDATTTGASGVGIGVFNNFNQPISVNGGIIELNKSGVDGSAALFGVQMVKLQNQTVKAGNVTGAMTVQITRL